MCFWLSIADTHLNSCITLFFYYDLVGETDGNDSDANDSFIMVDRKMSTLSDSESPPTSDQPSPQSRLDKTEQELKQTTAELETSKQHSIELKQHNEKLETDLNALISQQDKLAADFETAAKSLEELNSRYQQASGENEKLKQQLETMNTQLESKITEVCALTEAVNGARLESESLKRNAESLNTQLEEQKLSGSKSHSEMDQVLTSVRRQLLESENRVAQLENDDHKHKSAVEDLETQNADLSARLTESEQTCDSLREELVLVTENLQIANTELQAKRAELEHLNLDLETKQTQELSSHVELEASRKRVEDLNSELESILTQNKQLKDYLQQVQAKSNEEKTSQSDELSKLRTQLSSADNNLRGLESDKERLERDMSEKLDELVEAKASSESLTSEIRTLKITLSQKDDQIQVITVIAVKIFHYQELKNCF